MKQDVRYNVDDLDYQNSFLPKPVLRKEYGALFTHHSFLMQGLYRSYVFVALELPKISHLHLDPPAPPDCDN